MIHRARISWPFRRHGRLAGADRQQMEESTRPGWPASMILIVLAAALALLDCAGHGRAMEVRVSSQGTRTSIDKDLPDDPAVAELIAPYREAVSQKMSETLAFSSVPMERGEPEGLLGALACDLVLARARAATGLPVDGCVLNNGGLRRGLAVGRITLGDIYEVMPFDNEIVVLRFNREQMQALADQIAGAGGEPIAGFGFRISGKRAQDLQVAGGSLTDRDYFIATSDYLSGGGGAMAMLWEAQETIPTGIAIRDALIDGLRAYGAGGTADEPGTIPVPEMKRIAQ